MTGISICALVRIIPFGELRINPGFCELVVGFYGLDQPRDIDPNLARKLLRGIGSRQVTALDIFLKKRASSGKFVG
jgi:hypothetical protein